MYEHDQPYCVKMTDAYKHGISGTLYELIDSM